MAAREADAVRAILDAPGVSRAATLIVHSGFGVLSRAGHRAEDFIAALRDHLHDGTLLMPTMTWRTVTPANPVFDELKTPSHTGILTEIFRTTVARHRSLHPTHSVAGVGPQAAHLLEAHHLGETPCPANSPYGRMRGTDAWVLMLGLGLEHCTAVHHAEEMVAPDLYLRPRSEIERYECRDRHGQSHIVMQRRHLRLNRDFPQFVPVLADKGLLVRGSADGAPWLLMRLEDLYGVLFAALAKRPAGTLAAA
jgi:aminoglycoside 3-N-acetyltransferase